MFKKKKVEFLKEPMEDSEIYEVFADFLEKLGINVDKSDFEQIEKEMEKIRKTIQNV